MSVTCDNGYYDKKARRARARFKSKFSVARAMTVHKSQGNEFDAAGIIVVGGWTNPPLELIYTALSRFKTKARIVGTKREIEAIWRTKFKPCVDEEIVRQMTPIYNPQDAHPPMQREL